MVWSLRFDVGSRQTLRPGVHKAVESKGNMQPSMLVKANGRAGGGWGTFDT
jgi:hypothetical protein